MILICSNCWAIFRKHPSWPPKIWGVPSSHFLLSYFLFHCISIVYVFFSLIFYIYIKFIHNNHSLWQFRFKGMLQETLNTQAYFIRPIHKNETCLDTKQSIPTKNLALFPSVYKYQAFFQLSQCHDFIYGQGLQQETVCTKQLLFLNTSEFLNCKFERRTCRKLKYLWWFTEVYTWSADSIQY